VEITRSFEPRPAAAASARAALDASMDLFRPVLGPDRIDDLRLLVSELVTNSVRHGGPQRAPIQLKIDVTSDALHVLVTDTGQGFEASRRKTGLPGESGGWGLFLLNELADRWGIHEDGTTQVWFELKRRAR
jgi:anti-sigma regulatory factor (Ser/Thr protein kinase)